VAPPPVSRRPGVTIRWVRCCRSRSSSSRRSFMISASSSIFCCSSLSIAFTASFSFLRPAYREREPTVRHMHLHQRAAGVAQPTYHSIFDRGLDREEHGAHGLEPVRIDGRDTLHVLLGGEHQLVIHHVIRRVSETVQSAGRMQVALHSTVPRQQRNSVSHSLDTFGCASARGVRTFED